ncbi:MAG: hypothetical protein Q9228_006654 [Teloschistes exilis]
MPSRIRQEELLRKLRHEVGVDTNETAFVEHTCSHLEGASGLMSIVKCIMMLERGVLVPNADFREMNPEIEGHDRLKVRISSFRGPIGGWSIIGPGPDQVGTMAIWHGAKSLY